MVHPVEQGAGHTSLVLQGVVKSEAQVLLVSMCRLAVDGDLHRSILTVLVSRNANLPSSSSSLVNMWSVNSCLKLCDLGGPRYMTLHDATICHAQ